MPSLFKILIRIEKYFYKRLTFLAKFSYAPEIFKQKISHAKNFNFICTGNICRSPYAEEKLKLLLKKENISAINVNSFGLLTDINKPASQDAIRMAKKRGVDLSNHKTKEITENSLNKNSIYFCMEPWQKRKLISKFNINQEQIFLLGPYTSEPSAIILDPFEKNDAFFQNCFELIDSSLNKVVKILKN